MTIRVSKLFVLPCVLLLLHTLLIEAAGTIELNNAWNDQNPTMLLLLGMGFFDAPVIRVVESMVDRNEQAGTFFFALKLLGGVFWFVAGLLVSVFGVGVGRLMAAPQTDGKAVH